jgi:N-carbamoyl-L-amino-acid hydrolase
VRLLAAIDQHLPLVCGPDTVWTCGRIALDPGAPSIIPGAAEVLFQTRDISVETLQRMENTLMRLIQDSNRRERCTVELDPIRRSVPAMCNVAMMQALDAAAEQHAPGKWRRMQSGAGHDAQVMAKLMPVAMLFTPSIGGISHHWAEDTKEEDLAVCMKIMATAAENFLKS